MADVEDRVHEEDAAELAKLGYKQELPRAWSGFTNFAISFTIISVLAGTFTTFGQAWNAGGPIAISIGWPVICALVLTVAVSMSELTSAFPTAGGPYWWAARARRPGLELVHRLVQHRRPDRHRRLGRLRRRDLPLRAARPLRARRARRQLRRRQARARRDVPAVPDHPRALRAGEHLQLDRWSRCSTTSRSAGTSSASRSIIALLVFVPDDHQSASFVFGHGSTTPASSAGTTAGCRSGTRAAHRLPADDVHADRATTPRPTPPRRRAAQRSRRPRACGGRCSSRR